MGGIQWRYKQGKELKINPMLDGEMPRVELSSDFCHRVSKWAVSHVKRDDVIFATVQGSFLYGTAHKDSDVDLFIVVENGDNVSVVSSNTDVTIVNLDTFVKLVFSGTHQSIESLMSPYRVFADNTPYKEFILSLRPSVYNFYKKCNSAASKMEARSENSRNYEKLQRHALRLRQSAQDAISGVYSPVLRDFE